MKINPARLRKFALATAGLILLVFILVFVFRDRLLQKAVVHLQNKCKTEYHSELSIKKIEFSGLTSVSITELNLVPKAADTLLSIEYVEARISIWKLLVAQIQLNELQSKNGFVQLVKNKNGRNFDAFLSKKDSSTTDSKTNYAKFVNRLLNRFLNLVPTDMALQNLELRVDDMGKKTQLKLENLDLKNQELRAKIQVHTATLDQRWRIAGTSNPRDRKTDLRFFNQDTGKIKVPYLDERYNLQASFDSIRLRIDNIEMSLGELHIDGLSAISNLTVNHPKIASKEVIIQQAEFDFKLLFGKRFVSVDSNSTVKLNKIKLQPYLCYTNDEEKIYAAKISIPKTKAQDFIESLPCGLFTHFDGMKATGSFDYRLDFEYHSKNLRPLVFNSQLNKDQLKITQYGQANLSKLNGEFEYRALINNQRQRAVFVGASNPNYVPLTDLSPYLQKAVLTTEDPSFFSHRGFITEAFKQSIAKNIRTKKFARGGSTISMQLIKNAFLSREKTLSRKLEEILLVYLLENNRIVSKSRMLEVYFNIIEWGPDVYGIGEAAQYYFQKHPRELTLNECLFLANVIPSPKKFMYQFDREGNLKSFAQRRDQQLTRLMLRRQLITPEDTLFNPPMKITGPAQFSIKIDSISAPIIDTTAVENFDF
ncbi:MAG: glycosyl transferase [Flavobacterium sp.]|nr:glycosyl transferase [Flavobacterium sp.]